MKYQILLRSAQLIGATLTAAMLIACGGGSQAPNDPWASFTQQQLKWETCDPTMMGEDENELTKLGGRAQCALMRAPLNYANLALGELQVGLFRVAAEQPQKRLGSIFFNPGGPGGSAMGMTANYGVLWSDANPGDPSGKLLKELSNSYDLIGLSPRGFDTSSSLLWRMPGLLEVENNSTFDRSEQNLKNVQYNARMLAKAAGKNPLSQHINTVATANDMDLARALLGDAKLNYIGYSYGTRLGSWYASLFPERVGRMLLDSSVNIGSGFEDIAELQEMGRQRVIDEVILPYVARHPELFNLGSSAIELRNRLLALPPQLKDGLFSAISFGNSSRILSNGLYMAAAIGLQALRQENPEASEANLLALIETYAFTPSAAHKQEAVEKARALTAVLFSKAKRKEISAGPEESTHWSVRCNDTKSRGDEQYWLDAGNASVARYPFTGGLTDYNLCLHWEFPVKAMPPLAMASQAGPLLMIQSRYDALTPFEGAEVSFGLLPNASMIMVEGEYQHGVFPYGQNCVDEKVVNYFFSGTVPERLSSCAGKLFPADLPANSVFSRKMLATETGVYKDSVKAEEIMDRIRQKISEAH